MKKGSICTAGFYARIFYYLAVFKNEKNCDKAVDILGAL